MAKETESSNGMELYYDQLHFIPKKDKTPLWCAKVLYYNKKMGRPFVNPKELKMFRDLEAGILDEQAYKEFVDPVLPDGSGGTAEFFKSSWQACPVYMHLENIKEAQLKKLPISIVCKASDEFSKQKQQADNDRIIGADYFRKFLNEINPTFGIRLLREDEDPFAFVAQMEASAQEASAAAQQSPQQAMTQNPIGDIDSLKAKIKDNKQLAIYNKYLYKDGVEAAIEIGIKEYLMVINKYETKILPRIISDIKNVNAHIMRHYTSTTTGRLIIDYKDPGKVNTSDFDSPDASDATFFYEEFDVSFGQFVQMVGGNLTKEELKAVFDMNRRYFGLNGFYDNLSESERGSSKVRLGYQEFETQNMDVYAEWVQNKNLKFEEADYDYKPTSWAKKKLNAKRVEKHYNVWYKCYYIPVEVIESGAYAFSFREQAKYIYDFGPLQDQMREGDDYRYAKSSYVCYKVKRWSFAKIEHAFMPDINHIWHQIQNDLSVSNSDGIIWAESLINNMLQYVDSGKTGDSPAKKKLLALRYMKQTNSAIGNFETGDGEFVTPTKLFEKVTLNSIDTALKRLEILGGLYQWMMRSLGFNDIAEGQAPAPRQNFGGINFAMAASSNATYFMEEALNATRLMMAERTLYYIKAIVDEGQSSRFKEFEDMVGSANAAAVSSIKDIPLHKMNLHLEALLTDEQKADILRTADEMAKAGVIGPEVVLFLKMIDNVKYAYAILAIEIEDGRKRAAAAAQAQAADAMEQRKFEHQLKMMEIEATNNLGGNVKNMIEQVRQQTKLMEGQQKLDGQIYIKDQINKHRTEQSVLDAHLQQRAEENKPVEENAANN